ncbi:SH3KBP1-binding protein 1 [Seminavis robusta]|uniref:SH3KBP1-binding protein 1 n=1 Tax=Seminavis robusta TaxID=568900 RepID=A0A9N8E8N0_9STRA|nr:SH3KBP1-binding protein 1 [Seminavis robusta]|eukprot:Sro616_g175970.1 SH3KBP1-binding protein 1 (219) ;mRNA; f:27289-27945
MDDSLDTTLQKSPALFKHRETLMKKQEKALVRLQTNLDERLPEMGTKDDVIRLNVGGTSQSVLRRTLTQIDGSLLEAMFSGRWDEGLSKTEEGEYFIDQPIELFLPLINFLRALATKTSLVAPPTPPDFSNDRTKQRDFHRMVEYYGMSLGVYPFGPTTLIHRRIQAPARRLRSIRTTKSIRFSLHPIACFRYPKAIPTRSNHSRSSWVLTLQRRLAG